MQVLLFLNPFVSNYELERLRSREAEAAVAQLAAGTIEG